MAQLCFEMVESSTDNPKSPAALLHKLCCRLLRNDSDSKANSAEVSEHFQYALRVVGSRFSPSIATDEFRVVERIKRKLLKEKREVDIAIFSELYRKLASQPVLQNRWAILYFLLSVSENSSTDQSHGQSVGAPSFFGQGLPTYLTSTPAVSSHAPLAASRRTPGVLSLTHATDSSSGISSVPSRSSDPTPTPSSFAPNLGPTPSVHFADGQRTHQDSDGSRLASLVVQSLSVTQNKVSITGQPSFTPGTGSVVRFMSYGNDTHNSKFYSFSVLNQCQCNK